MIKAKEFWGYLCNELDYRFFAGVPCKGLKPLYDTMNPEFMHYIPAVNERVAVGVVSGARLAGVKGGILIDMKNIYIIHDLLLNFSNEYKIPFLIIAYNEDYKEIKLFNTPKSELNNDKFVNKLKTLTNKSEKLQAPVILAVGKGVIT
jgi:sulfopyruvate decarboxylase TPP-binding subunit